MEHATDTPPPTPPLCYGRLVLQPSSMKSTNDCAACDFNVEGASCKRPMEWVWRGDYLPASHSEYQSIKHQLSYEQVRAKRALCQSPLPTLFPLFSVSVVDAAFHSALVFIWRGSRGPGMHQRLPGHSPIFLEGGGGKGRY